jgi:molybdopterin/thiamine biosynthesis adenylyltransferase/ubiquitin-protein ligase
MWWIALPERLKAERDGLVALADSAPWFSLGQWALESQLRVSVSFDVMHGEKVIPLKLIYPIYFPDTPPSLYTRDGSKISNHQYGADGELCLEWRADNWDPAVTAAMMAESAWRLISGEADPAGIPVPSAHRVSLGQRHRFARTRFLLQPEVIRHLSQIPPQTPVKVQLNEYFIRGELNTYVATMQTLGEGEAAWTDPTVPSDRLISGHAVRTDSSALPKFGNIGEVKGYFAQLQYPEIASQLDGSDEVAIVVVNASAANLFCVCGAPGDRSVLTYTTFNSEDESTARIDSEYAVLSAKSVAIVGAGSVGSKIATSLARSGVGRFLLIDDDVLMPGNLVRHDLDWRTVGAHKLDGLADRLLHINPRIVVDRRKVRLGGQESAESTATAVSKLVECDLIIDATASPEAFNLCATAAKNSRTPMIWAEVFAGGIGGLVARSRPYLDPPPLVARSQINAWCENAGSPPPAVRNSYDSQTADGPMIADDGDVGAIATQASRMAIDTLVRPVGSLFPQSVYMIGLKEGWIFSAPFHTFPIQYVPAGTWGMMEAGNVEETTNQAITLIEQLIPALKTPPNADNSAT